MTHFTLCHRSAGPDPWGDTAPGNKPLVTVTRRADGAPDVAVSGGRARVLILDPGDTGPPPSG